MAKTWEDRLNKKGISIPEAIENNFWIDGQDKAHSISEMSNVYILNCFSFLNEGFFMQGRSKIQLPEVLVKHKQEYLALLNNEAKHRNFLT